MRLLGVLTGIAVLLFVVATSPTQAATKKDRSLKKVAQATPSAIPKLNVLPGEDGTQKYNPTRCEWFAIELNANFRESYPRNGYTSQFYCHAPNTIFLSFHYIKDEFKAAADDADDQIRDSIGRVMVERKWAWVKIDDEIVKGELPGWPPPAPALAVKATPVAKPADDENATEEDKPDEGEKLSDDNSESLTTAEGTPDATAGTQPAPWVHLRHPEVEFQKKLGEQDRAQQKPTPPKPKSDNAETTE